MRADQEYGELLHRLLGPQGGDGGLPDALISRLAHEHSVEDVVGVHTAVLEQRLEGADPQQRRAVLLRATHLLAAVLTRFAWAAALPCDDGPGAPTHPPAELDPPALAHQLERTSRALAQSQARLRKAAATDPLTGVLNARQFYAALELHLDQARQLSQPFSLLIADIDRFGQYNLRFGRRVGDAALIEMVRLILRCCRAGDLVARHAGDEFGLICPGTDLRGGLVLADRLRAAVQRHPFPHHHLTASLGVVAFPGDGDTEEQLLARGHQAAALAFRFGGNVVHTSLVPACEPVKAD